MNAKIAPAFRSKSGISHWVIDGVLKCAPSKSLPKAGKHYEADFVNCNRCNNVNWH